MDRPSFSYFGLTATADTEVTAVLPPHRELITRLTSALYRCGATAHTISFMKSLGRTVLADDAAASQAVVRLKAQPVATGNDVAANDWLVILLSDGTVHLGKVSSVSGLAITLTANLPAAASRDASVWFMGAPGDHASSKTRTAPRPTVGGQIVATASVMNTWQDFFSGVLQGEQNEPLMLHSNNATAAGTFELVAGCHAYG